MTTRRQWLHNLVEPDVIGFDDGLLPVDPLLCNGQTKLRRMHLSCQVVLVLGSGREVTYPAGVQSIPHDLAKLLLRVRSAVPYKPAPAAKAGRH